MSLSFYLKTFVTVKPTELYVYEHMLISDNLTSIAPAHIIDPIRYALTAPLLNQAAGALGNLKCK
jgi:hypothetical protein